MYNITAKCGEKFFYRFSLAFYFNYGQIANFNRFQQFPLQDCVKRRILYWNEPNFEPSSTETLKLILGGDNCPAKIKYMGDKIITRTPVIITSNEDVFPNTDAFICRMKRYYWKQAPYLQNYKKKPYPLCLYHLFKYYNII